MGDGVGHQDLPEGWSVRPAAAGVGVGVGCSTVPVWGQPVVQAAGCGAKLAGRTNHVVQSR